MLAPIGEALGTIGRAATLGCVAEVGDKTFFLTVMLAAWCPLAGIRSKSHAFLQQCLVLAGAVLALSLHVALSLVIPSLPGSDRSFLDWTLGSLAVACQGAIGLQAVLELRRADQRRRDSSAAAKLIPPSGPSSASSRAPSDEPQSDSLQPAGFLGTFKAYNPQDYATGKDEKGACPAVDETGSAEHGNDGQNPFEKEAVVPASAYGTLNATRAAKKEASHQVGSALAAFILPLVTVFLAEAGDKSLEALREVHPTAIIGLGTAGGYVVSSLFAVMIGFVLERQLTERRLLFAVAVGFWALVLVTASQALLHFYGNYLLRKPVTTPTVNAKGEVELSR
mmetsp:Transcript_386/g.720  ORF Transcript_386/g.720 Transcript_386/m.720 type:complete len:338 (+) Transcript_386:149-1162(+)